jgi:hypothetical protein
MSTPILPVDMNLCGSVWCWSSPAGFVERDASGSDHIRCHRCDATLGGKGITKPGVVCGCCEARLPGSCFL